MGVWSARAAARLTKATLLAITTLFAAASASAVQVSLPGNAVINSIGQTTVVPVDIANGSGILGVAVAFTYSSGIATATLVQGTPFSSGCTITPNIATPGMVTITAACPGGLTAGAGTLFNVTFQGAGNGVSPLTFTATGEVPNGCLLNEGVPSCETVNGQLTVGPAGPTSTATATATNTVPAATATATATRTSTATATNTVPQPTPTNTVPPATATNTATPQFTATATDTPTVGPSPTATQTRTVTSTATASFTATPTLTAPPTNTFTATFTVTQTPVATSTATPSNTATATPVPTPRIVSGAVAGSTRVFGNGAGNVPAPQIEIVAENGGQVIGTGGTNGAGAFVSDGSGIGLTRALVAGERIFARDTLNGVTGPVVTVGPQPPTQIPALDPTGTLLMGVLLGGALLWQLSRLLRRRA